MSKLFKLKEWLTVPDAAQHLSTVFDEKVTETEILQLAIEGKLLLSVYFVNQVSLRRLEKILFSFSKDDSEPPPGFGGGIMTTAHSLDGKNYSGHTLNQTDDIVMTTGTYNLAMCSGRFDMKKQYHMLVCDGLVPSNEMDRYYLESPISGDTWELVTNDDGKEPQSVDSYHPIFELPTKDSFLVVRTAALREFEQLIVNSEDKSIKGVNESNAKTESTRKTENLLRALTAIAIDDYGYDPESLKSNAPQDIANAMSNQGVSFDAKTIRNWLKEGAALLPSKRKED